MAFTLLIASAVLLAIPASREFLPAFADFFSGKTAGMVDAQQVNADGLTPAESHTPLVSIGMPVLQRSQIYSRGTRLITGADTGRF